MTMYLTKSLIFDFLQCPRKAFLSLHQPDLAVETSQMRVSKYHGDSFGEAVRQSEAGGLVIDAVANDAALAQTRVLRETSPDTSLFESAYVHDGVLVRNDVLRPVAGGVAIREAKASTHVEQYMIDDCAIQAWVLAGAGETVSRVELVLVNNLYVHGKDAPEALFKIEDVTDDVMKRMAMVPTWVAELRAMLAAGDPATKAGDHCKRPVECPFADYCREKATGYPLSELVGSKDAQVARERGYTDIREVPEGVFKNKRNQRIRRCVISGKPEVAPEFREAFAALPRPLHHLDFEAIGFAVPFWNGLRPYMQVPFQYSLHTVHQGGSVEHREFLHLNGENPVHAVADALLSAIGTEGTIVAYGSFESTMFRNLAAMVPSRAGELEKARERIVDMLPLVRQHYYHPAMRGSFSIKNVLPTVGSDEAYSELDGVADGAGAQEAFLSVLMGAVADPDALAGELLTYCALDTSGMVATIKAISALPPVVPPKEAKAA